MFASSADAKTSTGAPPWIWSTSADDPSKLNVTSVSGYLFSNCLPISVKASVNEAAAETVIEPAGFACGFADAEPGATSVVETAVATAAARMQRTDLFTPL